MCNGNNLHSQSIGNGNDYISKKCVMVMVMKKLQSINRNDGKQIIGIRHEFQVSGIFFSLPRIHCHSEILN